MTGTFLTLEQAAELEGIGYEAMKKRVQRNPSQFKTSIESAHENGGKERVLVELVSLSKKARRAYRASRKVAEEPLPEAGSGIPPWYVDIDLNWYIETYKRQYYEAVELAKQIEEFVAYGSRERTAYSLEFAERLGTSQRTLYRHAEDYLAAQAWARRMEKEEGRSFEYFTVLALCRKPRQTNTFPSISEEQRAVIENIWFDERFAANEGTVEMLYTKLKSEAVLRGWPTLASYATIARYIGYMMVDECAESAYYLASKGTRAWRNAKMVKGKRDAAGVQPGRCERGRR